MRGMREIMETLVATFGGLALFFGIPTVVWMFLLNRREQLRYELDLYYGLWVQELDANIVKDDEIKRLKLSLHQAHMDMKVLERWLREAEENAG